MENNRFHRDYSEYWTELMAEDENDFSEADKEVLHTMYEYDTMAPKFLNPAAKRAYDRMLIACDKYAKENGGIVDGVVDFQNYTASINLIVPYFEFTDDATKEFLLLADLLADRIYFNPTEKGWVNMRTEYRYFVAAHTAEETAEYKETLRRLLGGALEGLDQ